jgi:tRNA-binding protein
MEITWCDFEKVAIHVDTIIEVYDFPEARKPAYKLCIYFGASIIHTSSAQITKRYQKNELLHKQIVAIVDFPKKQIGKFMSECLVLGSTSFLSTVVAYYYCYITIKNVKNMCLRTI